MEDTEKVTITLDEYTELFETQIKYDAIIKSIFDSEDTKLNYSGDDLTLDISDINTLIRIFENTRYKGMLAKLIAKRDEEEEVK